MCFHRERLRKFLIFWCPICEKGDQVSLLRMDDLSIRLSAWPKTRNESVIRRAVGCRQYFAWVDQPATGLGPKEYLLGKWICHWYPYKLASKNVRSNYLSSLNNVVFILILNVYWIVVRQSPFHGYLKHKSSEIVIRVWWWVWIGTRSYITNGCRLTRENAKDEASFDLLEEPWAETNLGDLQKGSLLLGAFFTRKWSFGRTLRYRTHRHQRHRANFEKRVRIYLQIRVIQMTLVIWWIWSVAIDGRSNCLCYRGYICRLLISTHPD